MPRNRKLFVHGQVLLVTTRILSGLPLVSARFMKLILTAKLAQAQKLYPVILGDIDFMNNHMHLTMRVNNPEDVDHFMRHFKTETAHAINRLLGRPKGPVWEEGYDAPPILTMDSLISKTAYIYTNPQKANLVDRIEDYPGFNTWKVFTQLGAKSLKTPRIVRGNITSLPDTPVSEEVDTRYVKHLKKEAEASLSLKLNPRACYEALKKQTQDSRSFKQYQEAVVTLVREFEERYRQARKLEGKGVLGGKALRQQSPHKAHAPKKFGKRMICICSDVATRKSYIAWYKKLCELCREIYLAWSRADYNKPFPPGFYPPGGRPVANLLPSAVLA